MTVAHDKPLIHLRLEPELQERIEEVAYRNRRSRTAMINYLLELALNVLPQVEAEQAEINTKGAIALPARKRSW